MRCASVITNRCWRALPKLKLLCMFHSLVRMLNVPIHEKHSSPNSLRYNYAAHTGCPASSFPALEAFAALLAFAPLGTAAAAGDRRHRSRVYDSVRCPRNATCPTPAPRRRHGAGRHGHRTEAAVATASQWGGPARCRVAHLTGVSGAALLAVASLISLATEAPFFFRWAAIHLDKTQ